MSASQSAQTDALYKKYQVRTSQGLNSLIQDEQESITAIYPSQLARCPVPPSEATYVANKRAYPWIVQKTITYDTTPRPLVYTDTRVNNIIPFYNSQDVFSVKVGSTPLNQGQYTLDYDTGTLILYSNPTENPTITFCQYTGSKYAANQLLADASDGVTVHVDSTGRVGIGKITPSVALDVNGSLKLTTSAATPAEITCVNGYTGQNDGTENVISRVKLGNASYNTSIRTVIPASSWGDTCRLDLCTPVASNDNTETPRLSITPFTGYVGIGTTTPANKLDVVGDTQFTGVVTINAPSSNPKYTDFLLKNTQGNKPTLRLLSEGEGNNIFIQTGIGATPSGSTKIFMGGYNGVNPTALFDIPNSRVRIGDTGLPSTTLDVAGETTVRGNINVTGSLCLTSSLLRSNPATNRTTTFQTLNLIITIPTYDNWSSGDLAQLEQKDYIFHTYSTRVLMFQPLCGIGWYEIDYSNDWDDANIRYGSSLLCVLNNPAPASDSIQARGWRIRHIRSSGTNAEFVPTTSIGIANNGFPLGFCLGNLVFGSTYYIRIKWSSLI